MSTQQKPQPEKTADMEQRVVEYLRRHPDFFGQHPELLAELTVPHQHGGAVSLVERQVAALREQNHQLRHKFRELVDIARENEELGRRMHQLTLRLMEAENPAELFHHLYESLGRDFRADAVVVRLFVQARDPSQGGTAEFLADDAPERAEFAAVLEQRRPLCGRLKRGQRQVLFGPEADAIGSAVLLPLGAGNWQGLLAVGSLDAHRYHPGMGIDLLRHLGEVASRLLDPWVAAP